MGLGMKDVVERGIMHTSMVWGAVANTIPSGFWCLYHLLADRDTAFNAIVKEIQIVMKDRLDPSAPLSLEELDRLVGLDSALTEALRLYSESIIARDVMEDMELDLKIADGGKFALKKGSRVAVMMSMLHTDKTIFKNAFEFQWDRFCPDTVSGEKPVFTKDGKTLAQPVRPFGGGSSMCPGRKVAAYEIKAFIAWLLYRYDAELVDPSGPVPKIDPSRAGLGINVPTEDVQIRVSKLS